MLSTVLTLFLTATPLSSTRLSPSNTGAQNNTAWAALMASTDPGPGSAIYLPCGTFNFASSIEVNRGVHIHGGGGGPQYPCTKFEFPAGSNGIVFSYGPGTSGGAWLDGIWVHASSKSTVAHGVIVQAPVTIENNLISDFAGNGIDMSANLPTGSSNLAVVRNNWIYTNGFLRTVSSASLAGSTLTVNTTTAHNLTTGDTVWLDRNQIELDPKHQMRQNITVVDADTFTVTPWTEQIDAPIAWDYFTPTEVVVGSGVYTRGGDANAITFSHNNYFQNFTWGVADYAFLGNTHDGEHTNNNGIGAYISPNINTGYSVWTGCYSENNQAQSYFRSPAVVVGGDHGAPIKGDAVVVGITNQNFVFSTRLPDNSEVGRVAWGIKDASKMYAQFTLPGTNDLSWMWDYVTTQNGWDNTFSLFNYAHGTGAGALITASDTTWANGRTATAANTGKFIFPQGWYRNSGAWVTEGTAAPDAGEWKQGDTLWNTAPAVGQPLGWVATTSANTADGGTLTFSPIINTFGDAGIVGTTGTFSSDGGFGGHVTVAGTLQVGAPTNAAPLFGSGKVDITVDIPNQTGNTCATNTFTVNGMTTGAWVQINWRGGGPVVEHMSIDSIEATANNTLSVRTCNLNTVADINPGSTTVGVTFINTQ